MRTTSLLAGGALFLAALSAADPGWHPHEGGLLKYRVQIRFGEEPETMPAGWKFSRVSAVAADSAGQVYVFHRPTNPALGKRTSPVPDPVLVFDPKGRYLRSWGKGLFGNPHGLRVDRECFVPDLVAGRLTPGLLAGRRQSIHYGARQTLEGAVADTTAGHGQRRPAV